MAETQGARVGAPAPDFTLLDANRVPVRLSEFRGRAEVVLFFYPKDNTLGCSKEACAFRDSHEVFKDAGVEVIGISSDSEASHRRFAKRLHLPFRLLSDADGSVRALYDVPRTLGLLPGRVTYVIDREGIVRHIFSSQFQPAKHVAEAMGVLKGLVTSRPASS
jgi:thioredoxin-dependent peroxiredoxin